MPQRELILKDYVIMLRRHWIMILVFALLGPLAGYAFTRILPKQYKSSTLVLVEQQSVPTDFVRPVDTTSVNERLASMQQEILSRTHLEPIIRQYGLFVSDIDKLSMEDLVTRLQKDIQVTPVMPMAETHADTLPGFFVHVTLDNARTAQEVCSSVTSLFIQENLRRREEHSRDTTEFLSQQLTEAKANLDRQDAKLASFELRYIGSLPEDSNRNVDLLNSLSGQLGAVNESISADEQSKSFAQTMLAQQLAEVRDGGPDTLQQQLINLQQRLANLRVQYTDDFPDVRKAKADIAALQKKIAAVNRGGKPDNPPSAKTAIEPMQITQLRAQIRGIDDSIADRNREEGRLKQAIKSYQEKVQSRPAVEEQYKELTRGYQTALQSYNDLLKKRDDSEMATDLEKKQQGEQFRVLDPPNLPSKASFPDPVKFIGGGSFAGLILGMGLALFVEIQNTSIRSERDVEMMMSLPVLAMVPQVELPKGQKNIRHLQLPPAAGVNEAPTIQT